MSSCNVVHVHCTHGIVHVHTQGVRVRCGYDASVYILHVHVHVVDYDDAYHHVALLQHAGGAAVSQMYAGGGKRRAAGRRGKCWGNET